MHIPPPLSSFVLVADLQCFTMFHDVSRCFTMFHDVSRCFTMFHVHFWQFFGEASVEPPGLAWLAERLRERTEMFADHLGPLRILLGPTADRAPVAYDALSAPPSESLPLPEVQPLLDDQISPEMLGAIFARSPEGDAFLAAAQAEAATAPETAEAAEDPAEAAEAKAFDVQTAQIGAVIRHFVEEKDGPVMLDDLMPGP